MPTNIRRCLYIGLGGTGMNALLHTKKMFVDTYGEVPPMVAFLGIDTDGGAYNKSLPSKYGTVRLEPNEQLPIQVEQPRPVYDSNVEHLEWFPKECLYALQRMTDGAGQIRSNGRFALWFNASKVKNKMLQSWGDVHDADGFYESLKDFVSKNSLEAGVHFEGFQSNPWPWIKNADCLVISSVSEASPNVLREALFLGTPVISTDCSETVRKMLPKENIVPVHHPEALAEAMMNLMRERKYLER